MERSISLSCFREDLRGMNINMNGITMKIDKITVLVGRGKWKDNYDGKIYDLCEIRLPSLPSGKHICVHSLDMDDVVENRSYDDGTILEFQCDEIKYWDV